ncbi:MAG: hypothetical protein M1814_000874 [Vezdaea aestivalis]|nr:MAG: hypothetical protein M1814_000874 [Vezdaea aestivalis]
MYSQQPGTAATGPQQWHNDLFDCFSPMGTCCLGCWCPCILYGKTGARLKDPTLANHNAACNGSCWAFCGTMCCGVQWILTTLRRGDLRAQYNLPGSTATDLLLSCFCGCCQIIQEEKEVERLTKPSANAGYQAPQGGMKYPQ